MKRASLVFSLMALAGLAIWFGFRAGGPMTGADEKAGSPRKSASGAAPATTDSSTKRQGGSEPDSLSATPDPAVEVSSSSNAGPPSGSELLERWLSSSPDPQQVGYAIIRGFPQLKPEDHAAAAKDLVNLVKDDDFDLLQPLVLDPRTSEPAKEILYRDVLTRPLKIRFPSLLSIMRQPDHPQAEDAREALARYLDGDWGSDYEKWQAQIEAYLRSMN